MKTLLILVFLIIGAAFGCIAQPIYLAQGAKASFYSYTPVEDIAASSQSMTSVLNISNNEIAFNVPIRTFQFKKALMQEHFNEKYIESDKYPNSGFKGKINETIDWTKDGTYEITATGVFNIHGVDQQHTGKGKLIIKDGKFNITSAFNVTVKDHNITIPKIMMSNIAEVIEVKINADYVPYKKDK